MKKRLFFLYILLFLLLCILGGAVFTLLTMEPDTGETEDYEEYDRFQQSVSIVEPSACPTEPEETAPTEPPVYIDFNRESLLEINSQFDSWLMLPDTDISFPVVMPDNNSYYLNRGFDKRRNAYGCLFFDVVSIPGSLNRVIYGHNMGNNRTEMLSPLVRFQEQEYAQEHPYAYLSESPEAPAEVYELFAVVNFNLSRIGDLDFSQPDFETPEDQEAFVRYLKDLSTYETDYIPPGKLLILATCNRRFGSQNRLLICYGMRNAG